MAREIWNESELLDEDPRDHEPGSGPVGIWRSDELEPGAGLWNETRPGSQNVPLERAAEPAFAVASIGEESSDSIGIRPMALVIATLLFLLAFLSADGAHALISMRSDLRLTAQYLSRARAALLDGDVTTARSQANAALDSARRAQAAVNRRSFVIASYLPVVKLDIQAAAALSAASKEAAQSAKSGVEAASELGLDSGGSVASLFEGGRFDLGALESAAPHLQAAEVSLTRANELLSVPLDVHFDAIRNALESARRTITEFHEAAGRARLWASTMPPLLGAESSRRYLLLFQSLGEARATGGLIGLVGVLEASEGRVELTRVDPTLDVIPAPLPTKVEAPAWFRASYQRQAALRQIQQANVSPHLPVVSEVVLEMFEQATGTSLDGIVMMDAVTLEQLLSAMDPIETIALETPLSSETAADVILRDSYLQFPDEESQNRFLKTVVREFWARVTAGELDPRALADALGEAITTGHFAAYFRDPEIQDPLARVGLGGSYPDSIPNTQFVFHNNYSVNKVDYYLRREVASEVVFTDDGNATISVTTTLTNTAPSGPPSILLGSGTTRDPPGLNRMLLSFLLPEAAEQVAVEVEGKVIDQQEWMDADHPVHSTVVEIPAGESASVTATYVVVDAIDVGAGRSSFEMTLIPQTTVNPDTFSFVVAGPPGYDLVNGRNIVIEGNSAIAKGVLDTATHIRIELSRPQEES